MPFYCKNTAIYFLLICIISLNSFAQSESEFIRSLENHLINKEHSFKVEFNGDVDSFLNRINDIIEGAKRQTGVKNVFVGTMETTTSYSSSRATISFKVSYLKVPKLFVNNGSDLTETLWSEIYKRSGIIEIGVRNNGNDIKTIFNNALNSAVKKIEEMEKSVILISHEASYIIYDSFSIVKLVPEYISSNKRSNDFCYSQKELTNIIYTKMKKRNTRFIIHFLGNVSGDEIDIDAAYHNSYARDVYLENNITEINFSYSKYLKSMIIEFDIRYLTTSEQEEEITAFVREELGELITPAMNKFEIEKKIHDFIVLNVKYDDDPKSKSAYDAIYKGTTQCHGYSLLTQKFFDEAGIKSVIVSSSEMDHAWNMVEIAGNWYHLDVTWDDPIPDEEGRVLYTYYNLTDIEMLTHTDRKHTWNRNKYPSAQKTYPVIYEKQDSGKN